MSPKKRPAWRGYEERKVKQFGAEHVGGPGRPDGVRNNGMIFPTDKFEVKRWEKRMNATAVKEAIRKGRTIIVSKSGFTADAVELVKEYNFMRLRPIKLVHGNTRVA